MKTTEQGAWLRWAPGRAAVATIVALLAAVPAGAQQGEPESRAAELEQAQAEKAKDLKPYVPNKAEKYLNYAETMLTTGMNFHPYFESAYSGGGFTLGAGYIKPVSAYNFVDVRGSFTPSGYKRIEAEFVAPRRMLAAICSRGGTVGRLAMIEPRSTTLSPTLRPSMT